MAVWFKHHFSGILLMVLGYVVGWLGYVQVARDDKECFAVWPAGVQWVGFFCAVVLGLLSWAQLYYGQSEGARQDH
jgi:hypothetical protein